MEEIGRILKIAGKTVTVQGGEIGGCFGCMNEECKTNGKVLTAENLRGLELSTGQLVEISVSAGATASNAAFVLLPPLAGFVGAFVLVAALSPASGEAARAAAGVVGLAAGFFAVYLYRKAKPAKSVPVVMRILPEGAPAAVD